MAIIFIDGFDNTTSYFSGKWDDISSVTNHLLYSRFGTGGGAKFDSYTDFLRKVIDNTATIVLGFAVKIPESDLPTLTNYVFIKFYDGTDSQIEVVMDSDYTLKVYRGTAATGTLLGTSTPLFTHWNQWVYVEFKAFINGSTGTFDIHADGVSILSLSSQNTLQTANAYVNKVDVREIYYVDTYIDDLYMSDSDFIGPCRVFSFMPDADGTDLDFTANTGDRYAAIDDPGAANPDGDTTYIYADTVGNTYTYSITTGALETVYAIQTCVYMRKDDAGTRKVKQLVVSNSTDYLGSEEQLNDTYEYFTRVLLTDPDDSGAWTQTKLEAAEFGLEITA